MKTSYILCLCISMLISSLQAIHPSGVWYAAQRYVHSQKNHTGVELSPQASLRPDQYGMYTVDLHKLQPMPREVPVLPARSFLEQCLGCFK